MGQFADPSQAETGLNEIFGPREAFGPPPEAMPPHTDDAEPAPIVQRFRRIRSHARARRVPRWAVFLMIVGLAAAGAALRFVPGAPFYTAPGSTSALAPMPFHPAEITPEGLGTEGFLSWAYLDRRDGTVVGSANMSAPTDTASMIKAWLGADYLRRAAEQGDAPPDADLADILAMIRDGDNAAADRVLVKVGGATASVSRLVTMCQLTDSPTDASDWTKTALSARDAVRMGACLADGRAAGAQWTPWIMDAMRQVRGDGNFGIRMAFPSEQRPTIAIENGWGLRDVDGGTWHVNCLAVTDTWVLAVMQRYPSHGDWNTDKAHVDAVCQDVVRTLSR